MLGFLTRSRTAKCKNGGFCTDLVGPLSREQFVPHYAAITYVARVPNPPSKTQQIPSARRILNMVLKNDVQNSVLKTSEFSKAVLA
jgi:hypothetical protein